MVLESYKVQEAAQNTKEEMRRKEKFWSVCEALSRLLDGAR